jgi:molecular chaperone IbpA|tara:strand:+ start:126 stop:581 length:456 start_codon:yes stop_codon:yes gene_type:complete
MVTQALTPFDPFRIQKFGVGFDSMLDRISSDFFSDSFQGTQNFPPYNIIKRDDINYDIEMAVAGFSEEDLEIEYSDNTLTVNSKDHQPFKDSDKESFVHQGISMRKFTRRFSLADDVIVNGASLKNGMLRISMEKIIPEGKKKRLIDIVSE